jgi:hypothetical protein
MDLQFDPLREDEADVLVALVRAHHTDDDYPHSSYLEAAIVQIAKGEPMARAWIMRHADRVVGYVVLRSAIASSMVAATVSSTISILSPTHEAAAGAG